MNEQPRITRHRSPGHPADSGACRPAPPAKPLVTALLLSALLAGCAGLPPDRGRGEVAALANSRGLDAGEAGAGLVAELATGPLTLDEATRLALVNNPRVQAEYAQLGFTAADVYDAGRLSNPVLSASLLFPDAGNESNQYGFGLVQSFTDLLLLRSRSQLAKGEFERAQFMMASQLLAVAADTEAAYVGFIGSMQHLSMRETVATAAAAAAELAQRFHAAGNMSRLELALQQAAASEAKLEVLQARSDLAVARAALNGQLGLSAIDDRWTIAPQLPTPAAADQSTASLLAIADTSRLDLAAARRRVTLLADALGTSRSFRLLGEIEAGIETERETDRSRITGPNLAVELPLFNQGHGRVARAEAELALAEADLRALEIDISNAVVRAAAQVAAASGRVAHYHDILLPLQATIVDRTQREVNYMLESQFALLAAKQAEYEAYQAYLAAVRDYWLARVALNRAVGTSLADSEWDTDDVITLEFPPAPGHTTSRNPTTHDHASPQSETSDGHQHAPAPDRKHEAHAAHGMAPASPTTAPQEEHQP